MEDLNPRIVKKIRESKYGKEIKEFLISAIREELDHSEKGRWHYTEVYDKLIKKHSKS